MAAPARGTVTIDITECKGCGRCVESCPPKCLAMAGDFSCYGRLALAAGRRFIDQHAHDEAVTQADGFAY